MPPAAHRIEDTDPTWVSVLFYHALTIAWVSPLSVAVDSSCYPGGDGDISGGQGKKGEVT